MKISELPAEIQERLAKDRQALAKKKVNTPYEVELYNADGTRYFRARRVQHAWGDDKGNAMPFGGGSHWSVAYGAVQSSIYRSPIGTVEYELGLGMTFRRSDNGTVIPKAVATKKEVLDIAKAIEIFNL